MCSYHEQVWNNRKSIKVTTMVVIDNETLKKSYFIHTNLHMDYGISADTKYTHLYTNSKKEFNKAINNFQQVLGGKLTLSGTNNCVSYTRLIYTLKHNHNT